MLIFDGEDIAIHCNRGNSDFLVITFIGIGCENDWQHLYFAQHFVEKENINCFGIVTKKRNWYVSQEMQFVFDCINQNKHLYRKIITFGSSAGGYAALKYSRLLQSDVTIAFAPQLSIDPDEWPTIPEWAKLCSLEMKGMAIKQEDVQGNILVFFDKKHHIDCMTAEHIQAFNHANTDVKVKLLYVPNAGHIIYENVKGYQIFYDLIDYALCDCKDFQKLLYNVMSIRRKNYVNIYNKLMKGYIKHTLLCYYILVSERFLFIKYYERILIDETNLFKIVSSLSKKGYREEASHLFLLLAFYYATGNYDISKKRECKSNKIVLLDHRGRALNFSVTEKRFKSNNPIFNKNNVSIVYLSFFNNGLYPCVEYLDRRFYFTRKGDEIVLIEEINKDVTLIQARWKDNRVGLYYKNHFLRVLSDDDVVFGAVEWGDLETFIPVFI